MFTPGPTTKRSVSARAWARLTTHEEAKQLARQEAGRAIPDVG